MRRLQNLRQAVGTHPSVQFASRPQQNHEQIFNPQLIESQLFPVMTPTYMTHARKKVCCDQTMQQLNQPACLDSHCGDVEAAAARHGDCYLIKVHRDCTTKPQLHHTMHHTMYITHLFDAVKQPLLRVLVVYGFSCQDYVIVTAHAL